MSEANKQVLRLWFDRVWNQRDESAIDEMFAADGKAHGFPKPESIFVGPEQFKMVHRQFCGAFQDIQMNMGEMVAEGDMVAAHGVATMIHAGNALGFPATGKKVNLNIASFVSIKDGMIVEAWNFAEVLGMIQELQEI